MASRFSRYNEKIGFANALKLYKVAKIKADTRIAFSFLTNPVYFRDIYSDIAIFEQIFINGDYDIKLPFIPKNIIDLGANVGYASLFFHSKFPDASIIAVEPEKNNYLQAQKNLGLYKDIDLIHGAVWCRDEDLFVVDNGLGEAGFMISTAKGNQLIKSFTIPQLMKRLNITEIDILKIDIEGAEKEIFESNYETWLPNTKVVIVETHDRYRSGTSKAVFETINKYNFSLEVSGENLVFTNNNLV